MFGPQIGTGSSSRLFYNTPLTQGIGSLPGLVGTTQVDSDALATQKLQNEFGEKQLAQQGAQQNFQREFEAGQNAADRANQFQLGMAPINLKRDIFNQVSPLIQGLMGGSHPGPAVGVQAPPQVNTNGVYTPQQTQQQVNAAQAQNATQAGAASRQARTNLTSQGFGQHSPLLAALQGGFEQQRMAQNATAAREIPFQSAQANANQISQAQAQNQAAFNDYQQNVVNAANNQRQYTTSLIAALTGLV